MLPANIWLIGHLQRCKLNCQTVVLKQMAAVRIQCLWWQRQAMCEAMSWQTINALRSQQVWEFFANW